MIPLFFKTEMVMMMQIKIAMMMMKLEIMVIRVTFSCQRSLVDCTGRSIRLSKI
jgi:hypothetical protein